MHVCGKNGFVCLFVCLFEVGQESEAIYDYFSTGKGGTGIT